MRSLQFNYAENCFLQEELLMIALCHRDALHYNTKVTIICTDHFIMYLYGEIV